MKKERLISEQKSIVSIAELIGKEKSVICREIKRNKGKQEYRHRYMLNNHSSGETTLENLQRRWR